MCQDAVGAWARPTIVMAPAVGLTLKGHGRDRTLKGLPARAIVAARQTDDTRAAPRPTFQGPSAAMTF